MIIALCIAGNNGPSDRDGSYDVDLLCDLHLAVFFVFEIGVPEKEKELLPAVAISPEITLDFFRFAGAKFIHRQLQKRGTAPEDAMSVPR